MEVAGRSVEPLVLPVQSESDIGHARREAVRFAQELGFRCGSIDEIAIVVTELATNLVRHRTIDGKIVISESEGDGRTGIEILAQDRGPGITAPDTATLDHWSTNGTSGCGLGAVKRLMDEFDLQSLQSPDAAQSGFPEIGTRVATKKWLAQDKPPRRFVFSANSRPYPGEKENGDAYFVREDDRGLLVAVVDGLGHGAQAAAVSDAAIRHIQANPNKELDDLQRELHRALSGTRGAATALARINIQERRFAHIGFGNVATRVYPTGPSQLVSVPGVVGMGPLPHLRLNEMPWPKDGTLVVFSDGLTNQWDPKEASLNWQESVTVVGHNLLGKFSRSNDDATVVVAREV